MLIATGTGAGPVCAALGTHLAVLPQVLTWFPVADPGLLRRTPEQTFIRSSRDARFYGFPSTRRLDGQGGGEHLPGRGAVHGPAVHL